MGSAEVRQIAQTYGLAVKDNINIKQIILFGSYAKGNAKPESDIDIAVIVDNFNFDLWEMYSILFKLRRDIDIRIEPIIINEKKDPAGFLDEIKKYGEIVA
jgi:uncharacterized protein